MMDSVQKKDKKNLIINYLVAVYILFFIIGYISKDLPLIFSSTFLLWLSMLIHFILKSKVMIVAFLITFFTFLMGELFFDFFEATNLHYESLDSLLHGYLCLFISLCSLYIGSFIFIKKKDKGNSSLMYNNDSILKFRKAAIVGYVICAFCFCLCTIEKIRLAQSIGGYTATFVNFKSTLPIVVTKLANISDIVFYMFLSTLPDPKKNKLVFGIKLFNSFLMVIYGTRTDFILSILIFIVYFLFFERYIGKKHYLIKKRYYFLILILLPVVLVFLDYIMAVRDGKTYTFGGLFESVKHIINSLGGSFNVITVGYEYDSVLPNKIYSCGNIIDFFTNNIIAKKIFGTVTYGSNTIEKALYGNSFSNTLTYFYKREMYLKGYGMGSSYIAECYHDFGYWGVAVINLLYGCILSNVGRFSRKHFLRNTILFLSCQSILIAPRSYTDGFISCFLNFSFLIAILFVLSIYLLIGGKIRLHQGWNLKTHCYSNNETLKQ